MRRRTAAPRRVELRPASSASPSSSDDETASSTAGDLPKLTLDHQPDGPSLARLKAPGTPYHEIQVDLSDSFLNKLADQSNDAAAPPTRHAWIDKRRLFFFFGGLLGALVAWLFTSPEFVLSDSLAQLDMQFPSISLEHLNNMPDQLSALFDSGMKDFNNFSATFANLTNFNAPRAWMQNRDFKVGRAEAERGLRKKHAVVLIPGVISSGLESWSTDPYSANFFRQRLWGTTTMLRAILKDKDQWIRALSLDPDTGLDPPGVKVRAAQGFDAASYFITGYFIWAKIIENLAAIDYDQSDMFLAAYDWRLSYLNLQVRDQYFSRLKHLIEHNLEISGKKTVLVSHSMGGQVVLWFLKWVEAPGYGNGGSSWVEKHVEAFVNVAGTMLGVPKASAALLSGEMKDTVEMPAAGVYLLEKFFSRSERAQLFRSWAGASSMHLKGGADIWGDETGAPDDPDNSTITGGHMYYFKHPGDGEINAENVSPNLTIDDALTYLMQNSPDSYGKMMQSNWSHGFERDERQLALNDVDPTKWANPLEVRLPNAPSMSLYCMYGVGQPTERAYFYKQGAFEHHEVQSGDIAAPVCDDSEFCDQTPRTPLDLPLSRKVWIDDSITLDDASPAVKNGVIYGEGDGTVALLSSGTMCAEGWHQKRYNPGGVRIVSHEIKHDPRPGDLRGGGTSADHVDVLGNENLSRMILRIAAGEGHMVKENFVSRIKEIAKKIKWD